VHTLVSFNFLYISLMRTLHRLKLMSSPSLSELGKSEKGSPEDRGEKQKRAGANATWNGYVTYNVVAKMHFEPWCRQVCVRVLCCSIHNAVIAVFQKKGLAHNELFVLNEGVRYVYTETGAHIHTVQRQHPYLSVSVFIMTVDVILCHHLYNYCFDLRLLSDIFLWISFFV